MTNDTTGTTATGEQVTATPAAAPPRRVFVVDGKEYEDRFRDKTPEEVMKFFAEWHPDLHNGEVVSSKRGDEDVFTFRKRLGTKGTAAPAAANASDGGDGGGVAPRPRDRFLAALAMVPPKHLAIWGLAEELYQGGDLDIEAVNAREDEFDRACDEIKAVAGASERVNGAVVCWLREG